MEKENKTNNKTKASCKKEGKKCEAKNSRCENKKQGGNLVKTAIQDYRKRCKKDNEHKDYSQIDNI